MHYIAADALEANLTPDQRKLLSEVLEAVLFKETTAEKAADVIAADPVMAKALCQCFIDDFVAENTEGPA
jgi:hypothetical protein